ncbi:MAG: MATE family efflux transporter, partial [Pseudomonadota bacterium]
VRISQAHGRGDDARVATELRAALAGGCLAGICAMALMILAFPLLGPIGQPAEVITILFPYWASMALWVIPFMAFFTFKALFDAVGHEWTGVTLSYLGVLVNIPANYLFIHVFGLGLLGAGLASVLSQSTALIGALFFWRFSRAMAPFRQAVGLRARQVVGLLRESFPVCIGYAGEGGAYALVGIMMGWLGATALAANQVVNAIGGVSYMFPLGIAGAVSIRVGHAVGGATRDRLRPILKAGIGIAVVWQSGIALLFILFGGAAARAFSDDAEVIALATLLFLIVAVLQIADGIQGTALGALRGISDNTAPTNITLFAYWLIALPLAYFLAFGLAYGALGLWAGYISGLAIAAALLPWRYWIKTKQGA